MSEEHVLAGTHVVKHYTIVDGAACCPFGIVAVREFLCTVIVNLEARLSDGNSDMSPFVCSDGIVAIVILAVKPLAASVEAEVAIAVNRSTRVTDCPTSLPRVP